MARSGAKFVQGVEINEARLGHCRVLSTGMDNVEFRSTPFGKFDVVMSLNAMEHFSDPVLSLSEMRDMLKPNGIILMTFGPPWYAPYGSHMHFFCDVPWINLLFSEKTIVRVRGMYRDDWTGSDLNHMSVRKFEEVVRAVGLKVQRKRYNAVRKLNFLSQIPYLRELFINQIDAILAPAEDSRIE